MKNKDDDYVSVQYSWFDKDPDEPYSSHIEEVCSRDLINLARWKIVRKARLDGINIPPTQVVIRPFRTLLQKEKNSLY